MKESAFMKKKLLMATLSIAMAFAAAVPAFADGLIDQKSASGSEKIGIISTALNNVGFNARMNCAGNSSSNYNNRNVDLYYIVQYSKDQTWRVDTAPGNNRYYIESLTTDAYKNIYALNIYRYNSNYGNCDIMKLSGNEYDASIRYLAISDGEPFSYGFTCALQHYYYPTYFVGATRNGVGPLKCDVRWLASSANDVYCRWTHVFNHS